MDDTSKEALYHLKTTIIKHGGLFIVTRRFTLKETAVYELGNAAFFMRHQRFDNKESTL